MFSIFLWDFETLFGIDLCSYPHKLLHFLELLSHKKWTFNSKILKNS